jgi:uncharacterized protein involved in exopolysaccharide biosynthesis
MTYSGAWGPSGTLSNGAGDWATRPRYAASDVVTLLWRDRMVMLAVFVVLVLLGVGVALTLKTRYPAHSSLLVRLGQEYVYDPGVGDAARGAIPTNDQVIQSETEILTSSELRRRVVEDLGMAQVFPSRAAAYASAADARKRAMIEQAVAAMGSNLKVDTAPDTSVVRITYADTDAGRAALVLNRLLDDYLVYRRTVLQGASQPDLDLQTKTFQTQLAQADAAYRDFLGANDITDFDAEKSSLNSLQGSLTDENYRVQARLKEIDGRLAEIGRQVGRISPEVSLYQDTNPAASDKLMQLQIDRQDLLARYKPDAQPVRDIDRRIAAVQALIAQGGAQAGGARRIGINPVYQTLQTEQLQLAAESASLKERQGALADQLGQISGRRQKLTDLEPQYLQLSQERDLLQTEMKGLVQKAQETQAAQAVSAKGADNIRIVERATPPSAGKSLKRPVMVLAVLFAAFTALCVGLARLFMRRGFATATSASRTLDLPVLASARFKTAA